MADYIDSDILCQAYINIRRDMPPDEERSALKEQLTQFASSRAKWFLYEETVSSVEFKNGSIIEYITVAGSLYVLLSQYPKFREGVILAYGDVKRLADSMILEGLFISKAKSTEVTRSEARTGVVGLLRDIIDNLDNIEASCGLVKVTTLVTRLRRVQSDSIRLLDSFKEARDIKLVAENLKEILFTLSQTPSDPKGIRASAADVGVWRASVKTFLDAMSDYAQNANKTMELTVHSAAVSGEDKL